MVEMMGGDIGAESELGKGSTFYFTVNLDLQENPQRKPVPAMKNLSERRVLVVDDSFSSREILRQELEDMGLRSGTADCGDAALEELVSAAESGDPYDPGADGLEDARQ